MPKFVHKNYFISVGADRARFNREHFIPKVNVISEDSTPRVSLTTNQEFAAESEAVQYGFELGKNWIDKHLKPQRSDQGV